MLMTQPSAYGQIVSSRLSLYTGECSQYVNLTLIPSQEVYSESEILSQNLSSIFQIHPSGQVRI